VSSLPSPLLFALLTLIVLVLFQGELSRIETKISSLLKSRDSQLSDLRKALAEAQERNRELEEQLDEDRGKSIASGVSVTGNSSNGSVRGSGLRR
jgi:predicted Holliday junction resolvase-like endonuclease